MPADPGVHRADQTDVVRDPPVVRQQLAEVHPAFAVLAELPRTGEQLAALLHCVVKVDLAVERLQMVFGEFWLWIAEVHLAWTTLHKHRDHGRRLRFVRRLTGLQVERPLLQIRLGRRGEQTVILEQRRKRKTADAERLLSEKVTTCEVRHCCFPAVFRPTVYF